MKNIESSAKLSSQGLSFRDLSLNSKILTSIEAEGYIHPTPIQQKAIPSILLGRDLLGIAQTGTGKTAAFGLPLLQLLQRSTHLVPRLALERRKEGAPRALILVPTRELAVQVSKNLEIYGRDLGVRIGVLFGGVGQGQQVQMLQSGIDILVATPGRLLDLIGQKFLTLEKIEFFVLDEADRMLDMGFIQDVRKIVTLMPTKKQNLFFSATMPPEVQNLADRILRDPLKVEVTPPATVVERIGQKVYFVNRESKLNLLLHLLGDNNLYKVIVFVDMKHMANRVADHLVKQGILAAAIHGNKSQNARQRAIEDFTKDKLRVLVATDIAARGIDIEGITHVINFDLPHIPESYVHRIGRTARAGSKGEALSFCTGLEKSFLFHIEKTTRTQILVEKNQPYHSEDAQRSPVMKASRAKGLVETEKGVRRAQQGAPRRRTGPSPGQKGPRSEGGNPARGRQHWSKK